jgi:hypothetical protein
VITELLTCNHLHPLDFGSAEVHNVALCLRESSRLEPEHLCDAVLILKRVGGGSVSALRLD